MVLSRSVRVSPAWVVGVRTNSVHQVVFRRFFRHFCSSRHIVAVLNSLVRVTNRGGRRFLHVVVVVIFANLFILVSVLLSVFHWYNERVDRIVSVVRKVRSAVRRAFHWLTSQYRAFLAGRLILDIHRNEGNAK